MPAPGVYAVTVTVPAASARLRRLTTWLSPVAVGRKGSATTSGPATIVPVLEASPVPPPQAGTRSRPATSAAARSLDI